MLRLRALAVTLAAIAFVLLGCGGGSSGSDTPTIAPPPTDAQGTPQTFEYFRDHFADRLDTIGPNIGYVPLDVRQELWLECQRLSVYLNQDTVTSLCTNVTRAMEGNDPDLLNATIRQLQALEDN